MQKTFSPVIFKVGNNRILYKTSKPWKNVENKKKCTTRKALPIEYILVHSISIIV